MADQKSSVTTPKKEPSAAEAMFFFAIVKHTRNKADIDWEAVAAEQKFKNAEVAKVRFGQVKRKLGLTTTAETPSSSARGSGRKRDAATAATAATPTKVAKAAGRAGARGRGRGRPKVKSKPVVGDEGDDEGDGDDDPGVKDEMMALDYGAAKQEVFDPPSQFDEEMSALVEGDDEAI